MSDNLLKGNPETQFPKNDPTKGGAPKGKRISTILKEILSKEASEIGIENLPPGMDGNKAIAIELLSVAFDKKHKDKLSAIKEILDRVDGKVSQPVENTIKGDVPIDSWLSSNDKGPR